MHRQMHRTDVVPELAGRRSMSLVARSKKLNFTSPRAYHAHLRPKRLIDQSPSISYLSAMEQTHRPVSELSKLWVGQPVLESIVLGGRYSTQTLKLVGWSTSPRAYSARWSVQSPGMSYTVLHQLYLSFGKSSSPH